ncbi:hypothetical protein RHSIM_Rhsim05G0156900 [Rhododendron simsii]|uniref:Disease resistance N-terminal domain-containing protein n=1 Tax=Rhododendron simsii TaxID=118357 RepID=A0A834LKE0_RHOSS|nr:hypothetical protein RHSIM_Rhsim05G0156900 [Rhododendron simsii]
MAEAILGIVAKKATDIAASRVIQESSPLACVSEDLDRIKIEMRRIQSYFEDAEAKQFKTRVSNFIREIWDLAYDVEDNRHIFSQDEIKIHKSSPLLESGGPRFPSSEMLYRKQRVVNAKEKPSLPSHQEERTSISDSCNLYLRLGLDTLVDVLKSLTGELDSVSGTASSETAPFVLLELGSTPLSSERSSNPKAGQDWKFCSCQKESVGSVPPWRMEFVGRAMNPNNGVEVVNLGYKLALAIRKRGSGRHREHGESSIRNGDKKCRNEVVFNGESPDPQHAMYMAVREAKEFVKSSEGTEETRGQMGLIAVNRGPKGGDAFVIRDGSGRFLAARLANLEVVSSALCAEALAC